MKIKPTTKRIYLYLPCIFITVIFTLLAKTALTNPFNKVALIVLIGVSGAFIILIADLYLRKQFEYLEFDENQQILKLQTGILEQSHSVIKSSAIKSITIRQSLAQKFFNVGSIVIYTTATSAIEGEVLRINEIENPHDLLQKSQGNIMPPKQPRLPHSLRASIARI